MIFTPILLRGAPAETFRRGKSKTSIANTISIAHIGLVKKMEKSPWDMSSDRRNDLSISGPSIRERTTGTIGKSSFLKMYPTTPNRVMTATSKALLFML